MIAHGMIGHMIRRLNQLSTQVFSREMQRAGYDLTSVQFAAMDAIRATPGMDQAGVAAQIGYDRATIGGVIDRLEQKGYIARSISTRDRRARVVDLTPEGQAAFDAILPVVTALQGDILARLDDEERQVFFELARKAVGQDDPS